MKKIAIYALALFLTATFSVQLACSEEEAGAVKKLNEELKDAAIKKKSLEGHGPYKTTVSERAEADEKEKVRAEIDKQYETKIVRAAKSKLCEMLKIEKDQIKDYTLRLTSTISDIRKPTHIINSAKIGLVYNDEVYYFEGREHYQKDNTWAEAFFTGLVIPAEYDENDDLIVQGPSAGLNMYISSAEMLDAFDTAEDYLTQTLGQENLNHTGLYIDSRTVGFQFDNKSDKSLTYLVEVEVGASVIKAMHEIKIDERDEENWITRITVTTRDKNGKAISVKEIKNEKDAQRAFGDMEGEKEVIAIIDPQFIGEDLNLYLEEGFSTYANTYMMQFEKDDIVDRKAIESRIKVYTEEGIFSPVMAEEQKDAASTKKAEKEQESK